MTNTAIYKESGWHARVEILEDLSTSEMMHYRLRVIETLRDSPWYPSPENGSEFTVQQVTCGPSIGWWLLPDWGD